MTQIVVITATNTDVGKTVATASAIAVTRQQAPHLQIGVIKPAQTGVAPVPPADLGKWERGDRGDVAVVQTLVGSPVPCWEMVRYPEPLAPDVAARRAGMPLYQASDFAEFILRAWDGLDVVVVEGAGGLLVNLGQEEDGSPTTLLDVMVALSRSDEVANGVHSLGVLVVSQPDLGMLNHCLLTVREIARAGLPQWGVVLGSWPQHPDLAMRLNVEEVSRLTHLPVCAILPEGVGAVPAAEEGSVASASGQWWRVLPWCDASV